MSRVAGGYSLGQCVMRSLRNEGLQKHTINLGIKKLRCIQTMIEWEELSLKSRRIPGNISYILYETVRTEYLSGLFQFDVGNLNAC